MFEYYFHVSYIKRYSHTTIDDVTAVVDVEIDIDNYFTSI